MVLTNDIFHILGTARAGRAAGAHVGAGLQNCAAAASCPHVDSEMRDAEDASVSAFLLRLLAAFLPDTLSDT